MKKKYDIDRFVEAQEQCYLGALEEIRGGFKQGHWVWYIFPQLKGLGHSSMSDYYGIESPEEAMEYWQNDYLRHNLIEICEELLNFRISDLSFIMGGTDSMKVRSCVTLFHYVAPECDTFQKVIDKFFHGEWCHITFRMLNEMD